MKGKFEIVKKSFLSLFAFTIVLLLCLLVLVVLYLILGFKNVDSSQHERIIPNDYEYIRINKRTNETSYGISTLLTDSLGEDGFISYQNEDELTLISTFGSIKYECTGRCYCEKNEGEGKRRAATSVLSRGVVYLVSALTSVLAYKAAEKYFQEECYNQFNMEDCLDDEVRAELEECIEAGCVKFETKPEGSKEYEFLCKGRCLAGDFMDDYYRQKVVDFEEYDFNQFLNDLKDSGRKSNLKKYILQEVQGLANYLCPDLKMEITKVVSDHENKPIEGLIEMAEVDFRVNELRGFCFRSGMVLNFRDGEMLSERQLQNLIEKTYDMDEDREIWEVFYTGLCFSHLHGEGDPYKGKNPTIKCVPQFDPTCLIPDKPEDGDVDEGN